MQQTAEAAAPPTIAFPKVLRLPPEALRDVLTAMECPWVETGARARVHRFLELYGAERVVLVIRAITESEGNEDALVQTVIGAVSMVIGSNPEWAARGLQWLEVFDQIPLVSMLAAMRELDLFQERKSATISGWRCAISWTGSSPKWTRHRGLCPSIASAGRSGRSSKASSS